MATLTNSHTKQLQDLVACAICLDYYQDPRILPCSHTFCFNCIKQLIKNGKFDCPLRDKTSINENDINTLPINRTAKDMVEFVSNINLPNNKKSSQLCDNCGKNQAVNWCHQCARHLCETCTNSVHSMKIFQSHTIVPSTEKMQLFCLDHLEEKLKCWCSQCEVLVCRDCLLFNHKDHKFLPLKEAATEAKARFQQTNQEIIEIKENLTKFSVTTKSITNHLNDSTLQQKQDIEQTFDRLQWILEERRRTLIKQLEDNKLPAMNALKEQQNVIDQHLNLTMVQELCIKKMLESNDPIQVLRFRSTLTQNYKDFTEQYKKIDDGFYSMSQKFEKDDKDLEEIIEKILKHGNIENKLYIVKRDGIDKEISQLHISIPDGEKYVTIEKNNYARGYKFSLKQPLKLHRIRVRTNYVGEHIGVVVGDDDVVIQTATASSENSDMKWITIPLQCDIKNNFSVFVWAPSGNGSYGCKEGNYNLRVVNQNCSVQSKYVGSIPQTSAGSKIPISDAVLSIDMILDIEP